MTKSQQPEFTVRNRIRSIVFLLLYVELFFLAVWLLPFATSLVAITLLVISLAIIGFVPTVRDQASRQLFDRIQLGKYGVHYESGIFGDNWMRPYNEFRVDCLQANRLLSPNSYTVRIKHRVLANILVDAPLSEADAGKVVEQLTTRIGDKSPRPI